MHIHGQLMNPNLMAVRNNQALEKEIALRRAASANKKLEVAAASFQEEESAGESADRAPTYGERSGLSGGSVDDGSFARTFSALA